MILAERILADDISNFIRLVKQDNTTFGVICQLVPATRLELASLSAHAPKACVSTNFTTRA